MVYDQEHGIVTDIYLIHYGGLGTYWSATLTYSTSTPRG